MIYIFLILITSSNFVLASTLTRYTLKSDFPIYEEEDFVIHFHTENKNILTYTVLILTCKVDEKIVEEHVIYPGFQRTLPKRLYGDYFIVKNYTVKPFLVDVVLKFMELSNKAQFEVFFFETNLLPIRINVMDNISRLSEFKLGTFTISLWLHWKFEFIQKTLDHREDGLIPNSTGILICKATGGLPYSPVKFIGIESLDKNWIEKIDNRNEVKLNFNSKIDDHQKKVGCTAGKDVIYETLKIFHHPTSVKFVPPIDGYIKNGTSVLCQPGNGYPNPITTWVWVSGPENSELYFKIAGGGSELQINKNAPLNSNWKFECIAKNTIPNSLKKGVTELVSFVIGVKPIPYILICSIVISMIVFIIFLIILIQICRNRKLSRKSSILILDKKSVKDNSIDKGLLHNNNFYPIDEV